MAAIIPIYVAATIVSDVCVNGSYNTVLYSMNISTTALPTGGVLTNAVAVVHCPSSDLVPRRPLPRVRQGPSSPEGPVAALGLSVAASGAPDPPSPPSGAPCPSWAAWAASALI